MIRINTGDKDTDGMIASLAEKLHVSTELSMTVCTAKNMPEDSSEITVIVCDEDESGDLREICGSSVFILTRPIRFSAFEKILTSLHASIVPTEAQKESFTFEKATGKLKYGEESVKLTPKESELFSFLLKRNGHAVSRDELRQALWSDTEDTNAPDVYVCYLRRKLKPLFGEGVLVNERKSGYILNITG